MVAHARHLLGGGAHGVGDLRDEPVRGLQRVDPAGRDHVDFREREFKEQAFEQVVKVVDRHVFHIHGGHGHAVFFAERVAQAQGFIAIGHARVDDDHKGLAQRVQFPHNALFGFRVGRARHFCDGTVGGHDHAQRRVLSDDFARAQFRGLLKGDVVIEPGRAHHAGVLAFRPSTPRIR